MKTLEPKATFQIGEARIPVSAVSLTHSIDELPHAEIYVQLDNQTSVDEQSGRIGSTKIDIEKFNWLMRLTQEKILNEYKVDPDTQLLMEDGAGGSLLLKGFLGRPAFKLREGDLQLAFSMVHAKSVLQAYNSMIYGAQAWFTGSIPDQFFQFNDETKRIRADKCVAKSIRVVLEGLMRGAVHLPDLVDSSTYDSYPIHLMNQTVWPKVKDFLKQSEKTTDIVGLDREDMRMNFQVELFNILISAPNFFQAVAMFCQTFMFQMNAEYNGDAWLEWHQANTNVGNRVIEVPLQNITFNMANLFQLPVLQVLVQGRGSSLYAMDGGMGILQGITSPPGGTAAPALKSATNVTGDPAIQLTTLAKWPAAVPRDAIGVMYVVDAPDWITPDEATAVRVKGWEKLAKGSREENIIKQLDEAKKSFSGSNKARVQICEYMAKQVFRSLYLGDTIANITAPLNLEVRPGYMYLVKSVTGEELFTAYLVRVTHDIVISPDGAGAAITNMTFSHVKVVNAKILALEDKPTFNKAIVVPTQELPAKLMPVNTGTALA